MIFGWSLVHGGPGGNFLSQTIFDAVAYGIGIKEAHLEDIADPTVIQSLNKVLTIALRETGALNFILMASMMIYYMILLDIQLIQ